MILIPNNFSYYPFGGQRMVVKISKPKQPLKGTQRTLSGDYRNEIPQSRKHVRAKRELMQLLLIQISFQVALYCRHDLNVRSTTHLLLAFASIHKPCRPFLPRYFSKAIVLPTDWTSVADLVQTFDSDLHAGSLPAILRSIFE